MQMVGIKDLKKRLTYYLSLTKGGDKIIVTDRGAPVAILHNLDRVEEDAGVEERLSALAKRGMLRLPVNGGRLRGFKSIQVSGEPASELIKEDRR